MSKFFVAIMMGSESDLNTMQATVTTLKEFNIPCEVKILSAHRTPDLAAEYIKDADQRGCVVFIAAAGLAAHLAGAVAANTIRPVLGVPLNAGTLGGLDALLSTVQMPAGTPVACMSIDKAGATNAAIFAAQIIAIQDKTVAEKLAQLRQKKRDALKKVNESLNI